MKTQVILAVIALTFSLSAAADGTGHAHAHDPVDHSKMDHSNMDPTQMKAMEKAMEAEMIKIINTVDINERKNYLLHIKRACNQ